MNMMDCDNAHYVEFYIKPDSPPESGVIYYITIKRDKKWWEEIFPKIETFYNEMKKYCEIGNLDTHPVRLAENKWKSDLGLM
jgi:hypothetical protein